MGGELGLFGVLFLSVAIAPCIGGVDSSSRRHRRRSSLHTEGKTASRASPSRMQRRAPTRRRRRSAARGNAERERQDFVRHLWRVVYRCAARRLLRRLPENSRRLLFALSSSFGANHGCPSSLVRSTRGTTIATPTKTIQAKALIFSLSRIFL